jgi:hypothetical protein
MPLSPGTRLGDHDGRCFGGRARTALRRRLDAPGNYTFAVMPDGEHFLMVQQTLDVVPMRIESCSIGPRRSRTG